MTIRTLAFLLCCFPFYSANAVLFEAEDYDNYFDLTAGNAGGAYRTDDVDIEVINTPNGGFNVGWIDATEWLSFNNFTVETSGEYIVSLRVASVSGATASLDLNGGAIPLGNFEIPATGGWQSWVTVTRTITLDAGTFTLGLYAVTSGWNVDAIEIIPVNIPDAVATVHQHCGFAGWAVNLAEGNYTLSQLQSLGLENNAISSIQLTPGYEAVLYKDDSFLGEAIIKSGSEACLVNDNFNDAVSSIKIRKKTDAGEGGRAGSIPVGIENVNDSPLKAANYRAMIRFVPTANISIDRFYFGFKLRGAHCWDAGNAEYGWGDGGTLQASLVNIDPLTGLPSNTIATETVNACERHTQAKAEANNSTPVLVWVNTPASLQANRMYGLIVRNVHPNPGGNFFSVNTPLADLSLAGPHARNELNENAKGALLSLDPREHIAWSDNGGASWQYGFYNGQYRSYMNDRDINHPATRMPQYGFRLTNGQTLAGQPYYAYSADCVNCSVTYSNAKYTRSFTELGAFTASGNNVGKLTIRNSDTGQQASCTPSTGYGFRKCRLASPVLVSVGQSYTVSASGTVETMEMDWSQRQQFPEVGVSEGSHRYFQAIPGSGTGAKDVPNIWAGPMSPYFQ